MIDLSTLGLSADAGHTLAALVREDLASGHLPALEHAAALVSSYPLHGASLAHDFIASLLDSQGSYLGEVVGRLVWCAALFCTYRAARPVVGGETECLLAGDNSRVSPRP
jgi:hypothetical protein